MFSPTMQAIDYALDRLADFAKVNTSRSRQEKIESVDLIAEAVGINQREFEYLIGSIGKRFDEGTGFVVVGVLMGLYIKQHLQDVFR